MWNSYSGSAKVIRLKITESLSSSGAKCVRSDKGAMISLGNITFHYRHIVKFLIPNEICTGIVRTLGLWEKISYTYGACTLKMMTTDRRAERGHDLSHARMVLSRWRFTSPKGQVRRVTGPKDHWSEFLNGLTACRLHIKSCSMFPYS